MVAECDVGMSKARIRPPEIILILPIVELRTIRRNNATAGGGLGNRPNWQGMGNAKHFPHEGESRLKSCNTPKFLEFTGETALYTRLPVGLTESLLRLSGLQES